MANCNGTCNMTSSIDDVALLSREGALTGLRPNIGGAGTYELLSRGKTLPTLSSKVRNLSSETCPSRPHVPLPLHAEAGPISLVFHSPAQ